MTTARKLLSTKLKMGLLKWFQCEVLTSYINKWVHIVEEILPINLVYCMSGIVFKIAIFVAYIFRRAQLGWEPKFQGGTCPTCPFLDTPLTVAGPSVSVTSPDKLFQLTVTSAFFTTVNFICLRAGGWSTGLPVVFAWKCNSLCCDVIPFQVFFLMDACGVYC